MEVQSEIKNMVVEIVAAAYLPQIGDITHKNPKILICFAAVPGSGKTTLAKKLQQHYQALRINSDEIRDILHATEKEFEIEEVNPYVQPIIARLFEDIHTADNGIVILDSSIDRTYKTIQDRANAYGYKMFVIDIKVNDAELERRIRQRNAEGAEDYLVRMEGWMADHERYLDHNSPDFTWEEEFSTLQQLIEAIDSKE